EVDKSRAGGLDRSNELSLIWFEAPGDLLGNCPRRLPAIACEAKRNIRRALAELALRGDLQGDQFIGHTRADQKAANLAIKRGERICCHLSLLSWRSRDVSSVFLRGASAVPASSAAGHLYHA